MPLAIETATENLGEITLNATSQVFSMMLAMEPKGGEPFQVEGPTSFDGVISLLTFTGEWIGAGMFCCDESFACKVGSAMLMTEVEQVNADVLDGIGEMANMILGNIKEVLEADTGPLTLGIPTVVWGKNFCARTGVKAPWTIVPFECAGGRFEVRVAIQAV